MHRLPCFALLLLYCSGSKVNNDFRIPNVAELDTSLGSLGNIGNNRQNNQNSSGFLSLNLGDQNSSGNLIPLNIGGLFITNTGVLPINSGENGNSSDNNDQNGPNDVFANNDNQDGTSDSQNNNGNNSDLIQLPGINGVIGIPLSSLGGSGNSGGGGSLADIINLLNSNGQNSNNNNNNNNGGNNGQNNLVSSGNSGLIGISLVDALNILNSNSQNNNNNNNNNGGNNGGQNNLISSGNSGLLGISLVDALNILNSNSQNNNNNNNNNGGYNSGQNINIGLNGVLGNIGLIGQNDFNENIERPCQVFDIYCIRKYFVDNSRCKEAQGPVPDPLYRPQSTVFMSRINLTVTATDVLYGGLNGRIEEFYINKETDKLVLAVEFRNLTYYSRDAYYRFHRPAREPVVSRDYIYINYQSVISTIIIPNIRDLQLEKSVVFAYTNDVTPNFGIGPTAFNIQSTAVLNTRIQFSEDLSTTIQEVQLTEGAFYTTSYVQHSICDFGHKIL